MKKQYILIDICGTLYKSNTTFDFLKYWFSENWKWIIGNCIFSCKIVKIINGLICKYLKVDIYRKYMISLLKGYERETLLEMSSIFYEEFLLPRKNKDVISKIETIVNQGYCPVIVSATLDIIAEIVANQTNVARYYSSKLSYSEGVCNGSLEMDLLGSKLMFLKDIGHMPPYDYIVTDNYSDIDLVCECAHSLLVEYTKRESRWNRVVPSDIKGSVDYICVE